MRNEGLLSLSLSLLWSSLGVRVALCGEDLNKDQGDNDHIMIIIALKHLKTAFLLNSSAISGYPDFSNPPGKLTDDLTVTCPSSHCCLSEKMTASAIRLC